MSIYLGLSENSFCHPADLVATTQVGPNVLRCDMSKTKEIQLTQGKVAIVDAEDYEWLMQWKWHTRKNNHTYYALRNICLGKKWVTGAMHRIIVSTPVGMETDHKDGNGLNNRRSNLRVCTRRNNQHNQRPQTGGTSIHKGVCWYPRDKKWESKLQVNGKRVFLGRFAKERDAAIAYNESAIKHFGEYARLNIVGVE